MTLKSDVNFEEKLTCGLEKTQGIWQIFTWNTWMCQNWDFDGIFLSKLQKIMWRSCV